MSERLDGFALHHVCSPIDKLPRAKAAGKWVSGHLFLPSGLTDKEEIHPSYFCPFFKSRLNASLMSILFSNLGSFKKP